LNIGLFKELREDEELLFQTNVVTPVVFIKEAEIKKLVGTERKEIPIAYAVANMYLTNQRLLFLILYQLEAQTLAEKGAPRISGVTGTWFEMPISAITGVEVRPVIIRKEENMKRLSEWRVMPSQDTSCVELVYSEKEAAGRAKDYMQSMLRMGFFARRLKKVLRISDKLLVVGREVVSIAPTINGLLRERKATEVEELPPPPPPSVPTCPTCGSPATWIEQYQRYYCYKCRKYLEQQPPPPPP